MSLWRRWNASDRLTLVKWRLSSTTWVSKPPYSQFLNPYTSKIALVLPTVPTVDSIRPTERRSVRRSVGPSEVWQELKLIQGALRWRIPTNRPTDGPTVGSSVGRTVGELGGGKILTGGCQKSERRWHWWQRGPSVGRSVGEWERMALEIRSVGRSVGREIGKPDKQSDWKIMKVLWVAETWEVRRKGEIDSQVTYSGWRSLKKTIKTGFFQDFGLNQGFFQDPVFFKNDCVLL